MSMSSNPGLDFLVCSPDGVSVLLDNSVYRASAIKKATYKFGDRCHLHIENQEGRTKVILRAKRPLENIEYLAGEFCNEVLDQELREVVATETSGIRDLLIAQAFSKTSLIEPDFETADFRTDPAGIRAQD